MKGIIIIKILCHKKYCLKCKKSHNRLCGNNFRVPMLFKLYQTVTGNIMLSLKRIGQSTLPKLTIRAIRYERTYVKTSQCSGK